jgi:hypothetical protein
LTTFARAAHDGRKKIAQRLQRPNGQAKGGRLKTYGDAVALLHTFLSATPDAALSKPRVPDRPPAGEMSLQDRLYQALISKSGSFGPPPSYKDPAEFLATREKITKTMGTTPPPFVDLSVAWRDAAIFDKGELGASWYRKSARAPDTGTPSSGWTLDDSLSTAQTFAFALPEVGPVIAGGLTAIQHLLDAGAGAPDPHQQHTNVADQIVKQLERFLSKQAVSDELRQVIANATLLKSNMRDMLQDPLRVSSATRGFRAEWLADSRKKDWVLGPEFLGMVWHIVESDAFTSLMSESDDMPYQDGPALNLAEAPSRAMCTVDAYVQVTGVVVNALILYSLVCLMPEAALQPGWDPKSFDLMSAVRSPAWRRKPNAQPGKTAYDCWETLRTYLDPKKSKPSWIARVDPQTGDARKAFDALKRRLDRISFGFNRPKQRDGLWFLQQDASISIALHSSHVSSADPDGAFRGQCADHQSEVKDAVLSTKQDSFADPFRGFKTSLGINWYVGGSTSDVLVGIFSAGSVTAGIAAAAAILNKNHGRLWSPWNGSGDGGVPDGTYDQLCWREDMPPPKGGSVYHTGVTFPLLLDPGALTLQGIALGYGTMPDAPMFWTKPIGFMEDPIGRDTIAWMAYVLAQYVYDFNYKVDVDTGFSTLTVANLFYSAWTGVHEYAGTLLEAGATVDA